MVTRQNFTSTFRYETTTVQNKQTVKDYQWQV